MMCVHCNTPIEVVFVEYSTSNIHVLTSTCVEVEGKICLGFNIIKTIHYLHTNNHRRDHVNNILFISFHNETRIIKS
jgi:hypothetical protein